MVAIHGMPPCRRAAAALVVPLLVLMFACSCTVSPSKSPQLDTRAPHALPSWESEIPGTETCVETQINATHTAKRLVWASLPLGQPPAGGWPVYIDLVTDPFPYARSPSAPCTDCGEITSPQIYNQTKPFGALDLPSFAISPHSQPSCILPNGSFADGLHCFFDSLAGSLWDQRLKQVLVARGIAVLQINPGSPDSWDAWQEAWDSGADQPVLRNVFARMRDGDFGHLDCAATAIKGWSSGAQLVSWLIEQQASNTSPPLGVVIKSAVMISGGSYQCYNVPPIAHIGCDNCLTNETECAYPFDPHMYAFLPCIADEGACFEVCTGR